MKLIWKAFRTKEEWCSRFLNIASHLGDIQVVVKKTGDVISGSKEREITKCEISLQILERCSSNLALVICIRQGIK